VILLKGPVKDNLYPIPAHALFTSLRKFSCNNATFVAHTAKAALCSTWHRRLGHPSSKILQQLVTDKLICTSDKFSFMMFCDACQVGKSKHLPFHLSSRISTRVLELVHCDFGVLLLWLLHQAIVITLFLLMITTDTVGFILLSVAPIVLPVSPILNHG